MRMLQRNLFSIAILLSTPLLTISGQSTTSWQMQPIPIETRWAADVSPLNILKEYPRPQLERKSYWQNLNGLWDYAILDTALFFPTKFQGKILVPFPLEAALSGVQKEVSPQENIWYKTTFWVPKLKKNENVILNFGAVDWKATVYINGIEVGCHTGGYTQFSFDITDKLRNDSNELILKVYDPTDEGINPHGKQTRRPKNIYYTASSGIWQTVWLEKVPKVFVKSITMTPNIEDSLLSIKVNTNNSEENYSVSISAFSTGNLIAEIEKPMNDSLIHLFIKDLHLWSPDTPFLYKLIVKLTRKGKPIDKVESYFGMRKVSVQKDSSGIERIFLNNAPYYNFGVLDQGFWPEGLYTAPTDAALKFDIDAIKAMGFNTVRKHLKIEPSRWYYYADKIGLLVWQDFVNPPQHLPEGSKEQFEKETKEIIDQLYNHACITTWVLFNERWGAFDQKRLTKWVKEYDKSRLVNGHSGELLYVNYKLRSPAIEPYVESSMTDVHAYPNPMMPVYQPGKARVCGEFGGIGVSVPGHQWDDTQGWGYVQVTPSEFGEKYSQLIDSLQILKSKGLSGSILTEPFDVEGEENGLMTYDREIIKIPIDRLKLLNKKLYTNTSNFSLKSSSSLLARNIDITDTDERYSEFLRLFENGNRDSAFLRRLTLISLRQKDQQILTKVGSCYIDQLKFPFSKSNLRFIMLVTRTSKDRGFTFLETNADKVNKILGRNQAEDKVRKIISAEEIDPYLKSTLVPEWMELAAKMSEKFGILGEEKVYGLAMINSIEKKDWLSFAKYYALYFKTAYSRSEYDINNVSWFVFEDVDSIEVIKIALKAMKYSIENTHRENYEAFDTYANLLYKIGNVDEALRWQKIAVEKLPNVKAIAENLKKMKNGIPTWQ